MKNILLSRKPSWLLFLSFAFLFLLNSVQGYGQTTMFKFDFESSGAATPSIDNVVGTPSLTNVGTLTTPSTTACTGSFGYGHAAWDSGDAYRFQVNTSGFSNLSFSYGDRTSNTTISTFQVRVSTDLSAWTIVKANYTPSTSCASYSGIVIPSTFNNQATVYIEIYKSVNAGNSGNTYRIDEVTLTGTAQATSITSGTPTAITIPSLSCTNGTGAKRAIFIANATTGSAAPTNGTTYTANTAFGSGSQIGATGWYCVFNGTGTPSVNVTNLTGSTTYRVMVCEYDGAAGAEVYNTYASGTGNPTNITTASAALPLLSITGTAYHGATCTSSSTPTITYTITNNGTAASNVVVSSDNEPQFHVTNAPTTVAGSGGTATFDVTFTPGSTGNKTAVISVYYDTSTLGATSNQSGDGVAPVSQSVTSTGASAVVNTTATLNGNATFGVCPATTAKGFVYAKDSDDTDPFVGDASVTTVPVTLGSAGAYTLGLTNLTPNTLYHFRAYVFDGTNYTYSTMQSFTTLQVASKLAFGVTPPTSGTVGVNLTSFTVLAQRPDNSTDTEYTGTVTLTKGTVSGSGNLTGNSVAASSGTATFNAVQFDGAGTFNLTASSGSLTNSTTSNNIVISLANATVRLWSSAAGSAWLTTTNWTGGIVPGASEVAQFAANPTPGTAVNINGGTTSIAGIEVTSRTIDLTVGNNSGSLSNGTLTLNGGVINSSGNTIIRHNGTGVLTIQNLGSSGSGSNTMNVALASNSNNNISIENTGNVRILSTITGANPLTKTGAGSGVLILGSAGNTYSGTTTVTTGELRLNPSNTTATFASPIVLNGGTLSTTSIAASTNLTSAGTLGLTESSTIALGTNAHALRFADSHLVSWTGAKTITITGWTGTAGASGTAGKIFVGTSATGLTAAQLNAITFQGHTNGTMILSTGEIVPKLPSYTVTYDANGGTGSQTDANSPYVSGSIVTVLGQGSIERTGYTFTGWNTLANGTGTHYDAGNTFTISGNTTLFAQWIVTTYTLTYSNNGGTGTLTDPNSPYVTGSTVTVLGAGSITRTGYTFTGWNTAANGSGTHYNPSETFTILANTSLFAQWSINSYTLTYNSNGGTGTQTDPNSPYVYNTDATVLGIGSVVNPGFNFSTWNTAADGSGDNYIPGSVITMTANTVLYAQWISVTAPSCPSATNVTPIADQSVCQESTANQLTANISLSGTTGTPTLSYQWYYNTMDDNTVVGATLVSGATSSTFTPSTATAGTRYYFAVGYATDNDCAQTNAQQSLASNTIKVEVKAKPTATITPSGTTTFCAGGSVSLSANAADSYLWSNSATTQSINVTATGNFTVQVTVNGCQSDASAVTAVTVNSLPATPTITPSGSTALCAGESVTLTSSAGSSYLWSNGEITPSIVVSTAGTYTVRVTDGNSCQSALSAGTSVTVASALVAGSVQNANIPTPGPNVVISQVYGGGGNASAPYNRDFVELFNPTANTVSIAGWSIQYASSSGNFGTQSTGALTGSIPPGGYYLVQMTLSGTTGAALPTPNFTVGTAIDMAGANGKIALTNSTTLLSGSCPTGGTIVDFIGYGSANCFQGTAAAPAGSNTNSVKRTNPCVDANTNNTEFTSGAPTPRNSATALAPCISSSPSESICSGTTPSAVSVSDASGSTGSYTYQWYAFDGITTAPTGSTIPVGWTQVGTGTSFSPSALTQSTTFACFVVPTGCTGTWSTGQRQVTVNSLPNAAIVETDASGASNDGIVCAGGSATLTASGGASYSWNTTPVQTTAAITVSPASDTTYTVTVTSAAGCVATAQSTITVAPAPTATITPSGPTTFYAGGSVTLTADGGVTYSWNTTPVQTTAAITVSPSSTTTYVATVTNAGGCSDTEQITVNVNPLPTFGSITQFYNSTPPCSGVEEVSFDVNGLLSNSTNTLFYTVNNGPVLSVNLDQASPGGYVGFTLPLTDINNGHTFRVVSIQITGAPESNVTVPLSSSSAITLAITANVTWYRDADGDGYGNFAITTTGCTQPVGYVANSTDCNDANNAIHPNAPEVCFDGIDNDCDGLKSEGCAPVTTSILPSFCGSTLANAKSNIGATAATYSGPFTVSYLFRITNTTANPQVTVDLPRAFRNFNLGMTNIIAYGSTYSVSVAAVINGEEQAFSAPCFISTPSIPTTKLIQCGGTATSMTSSVGCNAVNYALAYQFEITLPSSPGIVKIIERQYNNFNMMMVTSAPNALPLLYDTDYTVRVKAKVLIDGEEIWGNFGVPCTVRTPAAPEAFMANCGENGITPASMSTILYANAISNTTMYRFTLINEELGYNQFVEHTFNSFKLSDFNALATLTPGATYSVIVDAMLFGNYYPGKDCQIVVPGGNSGGNNEGGTIVRTVIVKDEFKATAYPNPFANNFLIDVATKNNAAVNVKVYDMVGRLVDQQQFDINNLGTSPIGGNYPSGVYNVVITQGEEIKTLRVVKR